MTRRFFSKVGHRFGAGTSCAVLGLYVLALVATPALHGQIHDLLIEPCCEQSDCDHPIPEDTCSLCEFVRAAIPFTMVDGLPTLQPDIIAYTSFAISIPPVADATILPPCRAPPVLFPAHATSLAENPFLLIRIG